MKLIFDKKSYLKNIDLVNHFGVIYNNGFPDENEREDFKVIINRVIGLRENIEPNTIILFCQIESEVAGGIIVDWYSRSKSLHLTYLIISEKYRGKGLAKELINNGVHFIVDHIKRENGIFIRNVFFESNNPKKTKNDNFNPDTRLKIFSNLGAKWIDIPYVQPALNSDSNSVDNLLLLSFPQFNENGNFIHITEVMSFLEDLYNGLGLVDLSQNLDLQKIKKQLEKSTDLKNNIELKNLP